MADQVRAPGLVASPYLPCDRDMAVDVAIVGGGVTGLTLATLLQVSGANVVILERRQVGSGTTGSSTAHLTQALDIDFETLVERFGETQAAFVMDSVAQGISWIERSASQGPESCGFARVPGYRYSELRDDAGYLESEAKLASRLGLAATFTSSSPLPFPVPAALCLADQALVDPRAYSALLAHTFASAGGRICESTAVVEAERGVLRTAGGWSVTARTIVHATHTPLGVAPSLHTRLGPYTSYVLRVKLRTRLGPGLFWDCAEPYHYLRSVDVSDGRVILVGGEDHKTGQDSDPDVRYTALERWTRERFDVEEVEARWCHELFEPVDGLPYIGSMPGREDEYVATGFSGTGMTFGTVAALMLRDLIEDGSSAWEELYRPSRIKPLASLRGFVRENANVARRFIADRLRPAGIDEPLSTLGPGSGRVTTLDDRRVALYRDPAGILHRLSPKCTHMGCLVAWNSTEKTWDCPCHGGRFQATGEVLYGPPVLPLRVVVEEEERS